MKACAQFVALIAAATLAISGIQGCTIDPPLSVEQQKQKDQETAQLAVAILGTKTLMESMRNPDSFKLSSAIMMPNGSVCYKYRAQNGFGGMNAESAVLSSKGAFKHSGMAGFSTLWNRECAHKVGADKTWELNYAIGKESVWH